MSKRKADELELQEHEKKQKTGEKDKEEIPKELPRPLLFVCGKRANDWLGTWHFRAFWRRDRLPSAEGTIARLIVDMMETGEFDDFANGQKALEDSYENGDDESTRAVYLLQKGDGVTDERPFAYVALFIPVRPLAQLVCSYLSLYDEDLYLRLCQRSPGVSPTIMDWHQQRELLDPKSTACCSDCHRKNEYGECRCHWFERRVHVPRYIGFKHGKVVKP
jgi:hypothetical protein